MAHGFLRRIARICTGIAVMLAAGAAVAAPQQAEALDVYTTPGSHTINGRQWRTTCATYSSTVERCTTEIFATQVAWNGSRWVQSNAWVFNNLTYKPNPRSVWKGNPIATPGNHMVNGRKWYTECDTKWTGGNACRSMIEATVPERSGASYAMVKKMVFNNIVHFTAPVTQSWTLSHAGFGPIKMYEPVPTNLRAAFKPGWECVGPILEHPQFGNVEVWTREGSLDSDVTAIILDDARARTAAGARIGMSLADLRSTYPKLDRPYAGGLGNDTGVEFYSVWDGVRDDGSLRLYFEVVDGRVVGISLQPGIVYYSTSDRICGGP